MGQLASGQVAEDESAIVETGLFCSLIVFIVAGIAGGAVRGRK